LNGRTGLEILRQKLPFITVWYNLVILYTFQFTLFVGIFVFLFYISNIIWYGALIGQLIVAFFAVFPFIYITINSDKLRKKYLEKYGHLAYQHLWFLFGSYNEPIGSASLYFPILLKTDYFLPAIVNLEINYMTVSLFPIFIALPLGIIIIIPGILMQRPSGGFDIDVSSYLHLIYPEESREISGGLYQYIRHPTYAGRGLVAIGLAIIANNLLAIFVAIIYFFAFYTLSRIEDRELIRRFGDNFRKYCKETPAIFPRFRNWKKVAKFLFIRKEEKK